MKAVVRHQPDGEAFALYHQRFLFAEFIYLRVVYNDVEF